LRRNCLLQRDNEGKIQGGIEVTGRWGRRCTKLLDDLKNRRGYSHSKEEALDRTMWRAGFRRGFGPVVRQTTKWMNVSTFTWPVLPDQDEIYDRHACFPPLLLHFWSLSDHLLSGFSKWSWLLSCPIIPVNNYGFVLLCCNNTHYNNTHYNNTHSNLFVLNSFSTFKFLVTKTCHLSSLDETVLPSFKIFHAA
jgi:hypothetical protein